MKLAKRVFFILSLLMLLGLFGAWSLSEGVSDEQILQAADRARTLEADSFAMTIEITAQRPAGPQQATVRTLFKKFPGDGGDGFRTRIEFLKPASMQGQIFLTVQNKKLCQGDKSCSFFWGPNLIPGQPLKVSSGSTTVFGDSSVAETAGIRFAGNYIIKAKKETSLNDRPALVLSLIANDPSVAFQQVTLWVEPNSFQPIQAELFALSGQPLDRVLYQEYARQGDDQYLRRQEIENLLYQGSVTQLTVLQVEIKELPDQLFLPDQLGKS